MGNGQQPDFCTEFKQACDNYTKSTQDYYNEINQALAQYAQAVQQATARWTTAHEAVVKLLQKSANR